MPDKITEEDLTTAAIIAKMSGKLDVIGDDVKTLRHVLLEGNGVPPITVQVATLAEHDKAQDKRIDDMQIERTSSRGDKMVIWAALIAASVPFVEMFLRYLGVVPGGHH